MPGPIRYMERTRDYYAALGFAEPYRWAHFADVPFAPLRVPLRFATVALVTTAARYDPSLGDQGPGAPYNSAAKFFEVYAASTSDAPDLRISHVTYDRAHTKADDVSTYFPLARLREAAAAGRIGRVAPRFYGLPTNRSQRATIEADAPALLERCREDGVDAAVLVPNCPVCHQCAALAARHLEANGIATVVLGCAMDIVEHCGVPRCVFSDFPLGNSAGPPHDPQGQAATLALALGLLESAEGPRTTVTSPLQWPGAADWKRDYLNAAALGPDERLALRQAFDAEKTIAKAISAAVLPLRGAR